MPDGLLIQIGADVSQGVAGLRQLKDELNNLQRQGKLSLGGVQTSMKDFQTALKTATNPVQIQGFNLAIKALGDKAKDLKTAGLEKTIGGIGGAANKAFASLRQLANIIPGIGIAGLIGFAIGPIVKLFNEISAGANEAAKAAKNLSDSFSGASKPYQDAVTNINSLRINIDLAKKGFIDKDLVVNQYNRTIGETVGKIKTLDEAEQGLNKNAEAYIKFTLLKAVANVALGKASEKAFEAAEATRKKEIEFAKGLDVVTQLNLTPLRTRAEIGAKKAQEQKILADRKGAVIKAAEDEKNALLDIAKDFQSQAAAISKDFSFDFFGGKEDIKTPKIKIVPKFEFIPLGAIKSLNDEINKITIESQFAFKIPISLDLAPSAQIGQVQKNLKAALDFFSLKANTFKIPIEVPKVPLGILKEMEDKAKVTAQAITDVLAPAFQNLFSSILAGEDPIKAFFNSVIQSIQQVISKLIAAAIQAAIFSLILPGGGGGFSGLFQKALGFGGSAAPRGIGYGGQAVRVNLSGGFQLRGNDLLLAVSRTQASQGRTG